MSDFKVGIHWKCEGAKFDSEAYNRDHTITFSGGISVKASAAPEYKGNSSCVNPEEQLIAAVSSCHMLTFLAVAAKSKYLVASYADDAVGTLAKNAAGKLAVTEIRLHPKVVFSGDNIPDAARLHQLHEKAHANCIVANSISSNVTVNEAKAE